MWSLKSRLKVVQKRFNVNKQNQNKKYERKQINETWKINVKSEVFLNSATETNY